MISYTYTELKENNILKTIKGKNTKVNLRCCRCNSNYEKPRKLVATALCNNISNNFCSRKCAGISQRPSRLPEVKLKCPHCQNVFWLTGKDYNLRSKRMTKNIFCSSSCSSRFYNIKSRKFMRSISKIEKWIQNELNKNFSYLTIFYNNRTICNGLELDIFIRELDLAFELNGIFHYLPIFGEDRLNQQLKNDEEKKKICDKLGVELVSIDISKPSRFTEKHAQKHLDTIKNKIYEKLK